METKINDKAFQTEGQLFAYVIKCLKESTIKAFDGSDHKVKLVKTREKSKASKFAILGTCSTGGYIQVCPVFRGKLRLRSETMIHIGELFTWAAKSTNYGRYSTKYYATSNIEQFEIKE